MIVQTQQVTIESPDYHIGHCDTRWTDQIYRDVHLHLGPNLPYSHVVQDLYLSLIHI